MKITKGNDFYLRLKPRQVAPGEAQHSFADLSDLQAFLVRGSCKTQVLPTVSTEGILILHISNLAIDAVYGIEVTAKYSGHDFRYFDPAAFEIVEGSAESDVTSIETFAPEAYVLELNINTIVQEHIVSMTLEEYESLEEVDENTYYVLV